MNFEERPTYRSLIGKLLINNEYLETENDIKVEINSDLFDAEFGEKLKSSSKIKFQESAQLKNNSHVNITNHTVSNTSNNTTATNININTNKIATNRSIKDMSRSYSLNDLIDTANELITTKKPQNSNKKSNVKSYIGDENLENISKSSFELNKVGINENQKNKSQIQYSQQSTPFFLQSKQPKQTSPNNVIQSTKKFQFQQNQQSPIQSILKKSDSQINEIQRSSSSINNKEITARMDIYKSKKIPKERLEIDILPSYLNCTQNKLLIASSFGKIRVVDLFTYKIQKDELKNLLINGICMAKNITLPQPNQLSTSLPFLSSSPTLSDQIEVLYAVTNGEMNQRDDVLNVSNSTIIVTKKELKVLKKDSTSDNDNFLFLNPSGICYDIYSNLYICDSGFDRIKILDSALKLKYIIETASGPEDHLSKPKSVACYQNTLFVCDSANHRIVAYQILNSGEEIKFKSMYGLGYGHDLGMLRYPLDVCVDNLGILSVRDHHNNRVQIFSPESPMPFHSIEVNSQRETIYSMTVAENGDIYVAKMLNLQETDENGQTNTINKYFIDIY